MTKSSTIVAVASAFLALALVLSVFTVDNAVAEGPKYLFEERPLYLNHKKPFQRRQKFLPRVPHLMRSLTDGSYRPTRFFYLEPYRR
jgi:hypothetical protein